jgi:electron transfer flavoprotein beta subunit
MNILVCLKQTFATEEAVRIRDGRVLEDGVKWVINPYDEYALEEAIRIREKAGGEVTVVAIGPARTESALRTALAMGADHAVLVDDERLHGDEHTTAKVLAAIARRKAYDLILAGYMAVDNGAGQGGARLAEELGIPHIGAVTKLDLEGGVLRAERDAEGDTVVVEAELPALITAQQGLNEPRYPSLPGIMKAKKKPIDRPRAEDLGLDPGEIAARTRVIGLGGPPPRQPGRKLEGGAAEQARELVRLLTEEARVIRP